MVTTGIGTGIRTPRTISSRRSISSALSMPESPSSLFPTSLHLDQRPCSMGLPELRFPRPRQPSSITRPLAAALSILRDFNFDKHLHLVQFDVFSLFNQVVASPAKYSLTNVTGQRSGQRHGGRSGHISFLG